MSDTRSQLESFFGQGKSFVDDPFLSDILTATVPRTITDIFQMSLFLGGLNPRLLHAIRMKMAFFMTDVDVGDLSGDETADFKNELIDVYKLFSLLGQVAASYAVYGNAFVKTYHPFSRNLVFENGARYDVDSLLASGISVKYNRESLTYSVTLPDSKTKVTAEFEDVRTPPSGHESPVVKFRVMDPARLSFIHNCESGNTAVVYNFEETLRSAVKNEHLRIVNEIPRDMLRALRKDDEDFIFNKDAIHHFKMSHIPGLGESGLGIPPVMEQFRSLYRLQVYRKIDEAVGKSYMLPLRIMSPATSLGDPNQFAAGTNLLGQWRATMDRAVRLHREDPKHMITLPMPITYQEVGGSGKSLTPKDLLDWQQNDLLQGAGFPIELYNGSLAWQAMPMALRLFESANMEIHYAFNNLIQWVVRQICRAKRKDGITAKLQKPTIADNIERRHIMLQLMGTGEVSRAKGMEFLGISDPVEEMRKRIQEDLKLQEEQMKAEQEARQLAEAGIPGLTAGEGTSGGGGDITPDQLQDEAGMHAENWMMEQSDGARRRMMKEVEVSNPTLHAVAQQIYKQMLQQGESEGRQSVRQDFQQGGA